MLYHKWAIYLIYRLTKSFIYKTYKAIKALYKSRGAFPVEMAVFTILDGIHETTDEEWNKGNII